MERISDERLNNLADKPLYVNTDTTAWADRILLARELRAYRESGALEALKEAEEWLYKQCGCDRAREMVHAAIATLEAIERMTEVMVRRFFCEHGKVRMMVCEPFPHDDREQHRQFARDVRTGALWTASMDRVTVEVSRKSEMRCLVCDAARLKCKSKQ